MLDICTPFQGTPIEITPAGFQSVFGPASVLGGSWMGFALVTMLGSVFMLVLMFFLSHLIRNPKLEAWTRFEFFQVLATMALAALIAGHVWGMCTFDASILDTARYRDGSYASCSTFADGHVAVTPYCIAQKYLSHIRAIGQDIFQVLMMLNYVFSYLFKMVWESRPLGIGYTIEPLGGFQQLQNLFLVGLSGFVVAFVSVIVQQKVLDYLLLACAYFFMPIGIVLRSFPATREFGGALLAFVYASLFFYPLMLVMNDVLMYSEMRDLSTGVAMDSAFNQAMATVDRLGTRGGSAWRTVGASDTGIADYLATGDYINGTGAYAGGGMVGGYRSMPWGGPSIDFDKQMKLMSYFIFWPWQVVMVYFIGAVVLPLLNFIVYVEIARGLSKFLGSELDLTNITRMI